MKRWSHEKVPLPVVLEAIDHCFDKQAERGRKKTISGLTYCRHAVDALWEERKNLAVGSSSALPEENPALRLAAIAAAIESCSDASDSVAVQTVLRDIASRVRALTGEKAVPRIEASLLEIEHESFTRLLEALSVEQKTSFHAELEMLLSSVRNLDGASLQRTRDANIKRLLRQLTGIPRLSLFG